VKKKDIIKPLSRKRQIAVVNDTEVDCVGVFILTIITSLSKSFIVGIRNDFD
jgi:hypothetical protein